MSKVWTTTKIPGILYKEIQEFLKSDKSRGYLSVTKFVSDAVRDKLDKMNQKEDEYEQIKKGFEAYSKQRKQDESELKLKVTKLENIVEDLQKTIKKELGITLDEHSPQSKKKDS